MRRSRKTWRSSELVRVFVTRCRRKNASERREERLILVDVIKGVEFVANEENISIMQR